MPHFNYKLIMSCYQGITFTVFFCCCENSHSFVKIAKFVMVNEVRGIHVEMAFTSCLPHACTAENICKSTHVGL